MQAGSSWKWGYSDVCVAHVDYMFVYIYTIGFALLWLAWLQNTCSGAELKDFYNYFTMAILFFFFIISLLLCLINVKKLVQLFT